MWQCCKPLLLGSVGILRALLRKNLGAAACSLLAENRVRSSNSARRLELPRRFAPLRLISMERARATMATGNLTGQFGFIRRAKQTDNASARSKCSRVRQMIFFSFRVRGPKF